MAIKWFKDNKMIVNKKKVSSQKEKQVYMKNNKIDNKVVKVTSLVKFLNVHIDVELKFNLHIDNICRSAVNQLNAFIMLRNFLVFEEKKIVGYFLKANKMSFLMLSVKISLVFMSLEV